MIHDGGSSSKELIFDHGVVQNYSLLLCEGYDNSNNRLFKKVFSYGQKSTLEFNIAFRIKTAGWSIPDQV